LEGIGAALDLPAGGRTGHREVEQGGVERHRVRPHEQSERCQVAGAAGEPERVRRRARRRSAKVEPPAAVEYDDVRPQNQRVHLDGARRRLEGDVQLLEPDLADAADRGRGAAERDQPGAVGHGVEGESALQPSIRAGVGGPSGQPLHSQVALRPNPGLVGAYVSRDPGG
jgi:hypothetical protein